MTASSSPDQRNVILIAPAATEHSTAAAAIERGIVRIAYFAVSCLVMLFWVCLGPGWIQWSAWAIVRMAALNVLSIHAHGRATRNEHFEHVITWWPRGFRAIADLRRGRGSQLEFRTRDILVLAIDTMLAPAYVYIYIVLFSSSERDPVVGWVAALLKTARWAAATH
jgi:hypothetical protein